jgi:hypothetical protein
MSVNGLVLGAPKASQSGARSWAAGTPNILNVAVSRAKQDLYVIGSHGAWSGVGHVGSSERRCSEFAFELPSPHLRLERAILLAFRYETGRTDWA